MLPNLPNRILLSALVALVMMGIAGQALAQLSNTREVATSQLSQGVGAAGDAAATAGSVGSLSAKLRLMTSQLNTLMGLVNTIGSTTSGSSAILGLCGVTTSAPTYTTGQNHPCSLQTDGSLRVYLTGAANGSVSNDDDGQIADGGTNHTTVLPLTYAWNSDSGVADWTRLMHQPLDFDSGAGTENLSVIGIGLPASGGPVIGGTSSNPFNVVFPSSQSVSLSAALPAGTNNIGDVDVLTVPADPFGANADAASATGSISAKLRFIASTGIPITGTVQVQSNSANLATQTTLAAIDTKLDTIDNMISGAGANLSQIGGATPDPCMSKSKIFVPISQTTSTELFTGTASNRAYVCGLFLSQPSASTQTFALVSGTGTTCGTSVGAMISGTTAANGVQVPFAMGNGLGTIAKSDTDAENVCLLQSGSDRITGVLSYVVATN